MASNFPVPRARASLEVLRAEARDELETVIFERCLDGGDPWDFMEELPSVDELVVYLLRADAINANGGQLPSPTREYRVLRQIALDHPPLTRTVWSLIGRLRGGLAAAAPLSHAISHGPGPRTRE